MNRKIVTRNRFNSKQRELPQFVSTAPRFYAGGLPAAHEKSDASLRNVMACNLDYPDGERALARSSVDNMTSEQIFDDVTVLEESLDYASLGSFQIDTEIGRCTGSSRDFISPSLQMTLSDVGWESFFSQDGYDDDAPSVCFENISRKIGFPPMRECKAKSGCKHVIYDGGANEKRRIANTTQSTSTLCDGMKTLSDTSQSPHEHSEKCDKKKGDIKTNKRRTRKYLRPRRSRYCHLCARHERNVKMVGCTNITKSICQKSVCVKCIELYQLDASEKNWKCPHCQQNCPTRAKCFSYDRQTAERREQTRRARFLAATD